MTIATATDVQNHFSSYLQSVANGNEVIISMNGREVARLVSSNPTGFGADAPRREPGFLNFR